MRSMWLCFAPQIPASELKSLHFLREKEAFRESSLMTPFLTHVLTHMDNLPRVGTSYPLHHHDGWGFYHFVPSIFVMVPWVDWPPEDNTRQTYVNQNDSTS